MMNKVEITKILVAIEVVIALVIIGLIIYLRDPLSVWGYMAGRIINICISNNQFRCP